MKKKGWILLLVLVCVAFLVKKKKKASGDDRQGELVRSQAEDRVPLPALLSEKVCLNFRISGEFLT